MNKHILSTTFRNNTIVVIYIFLVSQIMQNGDKLFGNTDNILAPFFVLLLFCLSAAVVGGLVFSKSLLLFLENKKEESILSAVYSIGWLGLYTMLGFIVIFLMN